MCDIEEDQRGYKEVRGKMHLETWEAPLGLDDAAGTTGPQSGLRRSDGRFSTPDQLLAGLPQGCSHDRASSQLAPTRSKTHKHIKQHICMLTRAAARCLKFIEGKSGDLKLTLRDQQLLSQNLPYNGPRAYITSNAVCCKRSISHLLRLPFLVWYSMVHCLFDLMSWVSYSLILARIL